MVLPIIDEETRLKSMERCPRLAGCDSPLCPLDPYLKLKVSVPGTPLCFWYHLAKTIEEMAEIPPCVVDKLPIYIVHLLRCGVFRGPEAESPPRGFQICALGGLSSRVRGSGRG